MDDGSRSDPSGGWTRRLPRVLQLAVHLLVWGFDPARWAGGALERES